MSAAHDPTFPIGAAIAFCTWRLLDKRKRRNPDGPFLGNSPVWGALGSSMLGLFVGGVVHPAPSTLAFRPCPRSPCVQLVLAFQPKPLGS